MSDEEKVSAPDDESTEEICEICGSVKYPEDGKYICPHCDEKIDYFGDDDDKPAF